MQGFGVIPVQTRAAVRACWTIDSWLVLHDGRDAASGGASGASGFANVSATTSSGASMEPSLLAAESGIETTSPDASAP